MHEVHDLTPHTITKIFFQKVCYVLNFFVFLQPLLSNGALAQLARAFDWQSRGREFDSHTLHKEST